MRGLENRIKALEEREGMGRRVLLCLWGPKSATQVRAAVRSKAIAELVSESQIDVLAVPWLKDRSL